MSSSNLDKLAKQIAGLLKDERDRAVRDALARLRSQPVRVTRNFSGR